MYQDTATVTVSAEYAGKETEAVDNANVLIGLKVDGETRFTVEFNGKLDAPQDATHICVTLSNGLSYHGEITDGRADEVGGYIAFDCDGIDPALLG